MVSTTPRAEPQSGQSCGPCSRQCRAADCEGSLVLGTGCCQDHSQRKASIPLGSWHKETCSHTFTGNPPSWSWRYHPTVARPEVAHPCESTKGSPFIHSSANQSLPGTRCYAGCWRLSNDQVRHVPNLPGSALGRAPGSKQRVDVAWGLLASSLYF